MEIVADQVYSLDYLRFSEAVEGPWLRTILARARSVFAGLGRGRHYEAAHSIPMISSDPSVAPEQAFFDILGPGAFDEDGSLKL